MNLSHLQFSARQILIHWIQSRSPLERVVGGIFKDAKMGSSERRELQSRVFTWARYWPLFAEGFDVRHIDSAASTQALTARIAETWDWQPERWQKLHSKTRPLAEDHLRRHLAVVHGVHSDILAMIPDNDLFAFHEYLHASLAEAPLAIRTRDTATVARLRASHPEIEFRAGAFSDLCLKTSERWAATQSPEYLAGNFEVQDESSQLVALACGVEPGMRVLDLCAGAGGKSLHLAHLMQGRGEVHAWDPAHKKLQELQKRTRRWGFECVRPLAAAPTGRANYDLVLVDAPCSSLGTLRRRPQLLATTSDQELVRLFGLQRSLVERAHELARPGGIVVYATCSILPSENHAQVRDRASAPFESAELQSFLAGLRKSPGAKISDVPTEDFGVWCAQISACEEFSGDGFFVARTRA